MLASLSTAYAVMSDRSDVLAIEITIASDLIEAMERNLKVVAGKGKVAQYLVARQTREIRKMERRLGVAQSEYDSIQSLMILTIDKEEKALLEYQFV